jgi:hypothetical protein
VTDAAEHLLELLRRLDAASDPGERERLGDEVMLAVYHFGRALETGEETDASARELAAASAPLVHRVTGPLGLFARRIPERFSYGWQPEEWEDVCRARSALEFLLELYGPGETADWLRSQIEPDADDDLLRTRCPEEGLVPPAEVPPGIPRSHWWWWCPALPEDGGAITG